MIGSSPTCNLMNTIEANCVHEIASWARLWLFLVFLRCASAEKVRAALCRLCRS